MTENYNIMQYFNKQRNFHFLNQLMSYRNSLSGVTITSPRNVSSFPQQLQTALTQNDVSRIVGVPVRGGEKIQGQSRITYMPYEKKVVQYQERQYVERVPVKRRVLQYEQRIVIEEIPREVVKTDYYAVENIKQYVKQIIPEKQIEMVPVERKVRKIQYVPVEKQIVHYPEGQDPNYAKKQSRVILRNQGVNVRQDAQFIPLDPKLIYNYSKDHGNSPIGFVENGYKHNLSTTPMPTAYAEQGYYTGNPQVYYNVEPQSPRIQTYSTRQDINIYPH